MPDETLPGSVVGTRPDRSETAEKSMVQREIRL
jgi:hypothetical protein